MEIRRLVSLASVAAALAVSVTPAFSAPLPWLSYAAKFVCGSENAVPDVTIVSGRYRTVVNIHNPHYLMDPTGLPVPLTFFKKVAVALPQGEQVLRPSCKQQELLLADHALAVNCGNIRKLLALSGVTIPNYIEGFVVIEVPPQPSEDNVPPELDVVAVYTARHRTGMSPDVKDYDVQSIDVEEVTPRSIIGTPDLDLCPTD